LVHIEYRLAIRIDAAGGMWHWVSADTTRETNYHRRADSTAEGNILRQYSLFVENFGLTISSTIDLLEKTVN